jgi:hypothetical protein
LGCWLLVAGVVTFNLSPVVSTSLWIFGSVKIFQLSHVLKKRLSHKDKSEGMNTIARTLHQHPFTCVVLLLVIMFLLRLQQITIKRPVIVSSQSKSYHHTSNDTLMICGRNAHQPFDSQVSLSADKLLSTAKPNGTVIIGYDDMHHVQTNNHINAFLHAIDFAFDQNMQLQIIENSWVYNSLQKLFQVSPKDFEQYGILTVTKHLGTTLNSSNTVMKSGDEMYFYHTNMPIEVKLRQRLKMLRYLWTRPSLNACSIIRELSLPSQYIVIHNRWMKHNGCLHRLGNLAYIIKNRTGIQIDRRTPCLLEPSYIKSILQKNGLLDKSNPIFVIGDGINPDIIHQLQSDLDIGSRVKTVPQNITTTEGDMLLAVLANLFIGTPTSTLSGHVAKARIALGFDEKTNYLFPKKRNNVTSNGWEFICQSMECLLNTTFMHNYVG